jgi:hypothetical protein
VLALRPPFEGIIFNPAQQLGIASKVGNLVYIIVLNIDPWSIDLKMLGTLKIEETWIRGTLV